jgi:endonuclease/exonuclease/phosphatase family metal-dependent hydrolase
MGVSEGAPDSGLKDRNFLSRASDGSFDLRVMSWNVWKGSILPPDGVRQESFKRIVHAVKPDVVCLQEVPGSKAKELSEMMDSLLPLGEGIRWHVHSHPNTDNVVLSRYPLRRGEHELIIPLGPLFGNISLGHVMCLVDIPDPFNTPDVYLICAHVLSGRNISARERHTDSIARWLRGLIRQNERSSLPVGTPIVILGDLNVYGGQPDDPARHLTTLLTGDIVDENTFGPDFAPDWDGTRLVEVKPRHNAWEKDYYTWRLDKDTFPPDALDRIIYTDSALTVRKSFVLNTMLMTEGELRESGLMTSDVLKAGKAGDFDHIPLVVDFGFTRRPLDDRRGQPNGPANGGQPIR